MSSMDVPEMAINAAGHPMIMKNFYGSRVFRELEGKAYEQERERERKRERDKRGIINRPARCFAFLDVRTPSFVKDFSGFD